MPESAVKETTEEKRFCLVSLKKKIGSLLDRRCSSSSVCHVSRIVPIMSFSGLSSSVSHFSRPCGGRSLQFHKAEKHGACWILCRVGVGSGIRLWLCGSEDRSLKALRFERFQKSWVPSGYVKIVIENGHINSGFIHWKWWFSIAMLVIARG